MSEIRPITIDEYPELIRIVGEAYPAEGIDTRKARAAAVERFQKTQPDDIWTPWGVFRDGKMVGVYRNFDFELNVRGHIMPAGGLSLVAVDLAHKKKHVAKEIVEAFLCHYDEQAYAMTTLWPFRIDFYHKMGFGLGGRRYQYRVKPRDLPHGTTKDHVRLLSIDDVPLLHQCYNDYVQKQNGMMKHGLARWRTIFEYAEKLHFAGCEIDGRLEGYVAYKFDKPENPTYMYDSNMIVPVLIYHTPRALSELLTFLHSQLDQVNRIHLEVSEDDFYFLMANPVMGTGGSIAPNYHESHIAGAGIMYRVMDVGCLMAQLTEPTFGNDKLSLAISLTDTFFASNNGRTVVEFDTGLGRVVENGTAEVEISLDIAEFSSLVMGAIGFRALHTYGLATISDESCIDRLEALFAYHQKPTCVTGF